jgi:hypothetical protein
MESPEHLPSLSALSTEAFVTYKKNILLCGMLLLLVYIFLIPNIIWNSYSHSVSGMWAIVLRTLSFLGQIVSIYFVIAFIRSLISLIEGNKPSIRQVMPSFRQSLRPLITIVMLAIISMPIFSFIGGVGLLLTVTTTPYALAIFLLYFVMLFIVFLISFVITGTFLFSVRYELWPLRALRNFFQSIRGRFMPLFTRYLGIFSIMLVLVLLLAILVGFLYGNRQSNSLPFTIVLLLSVFFLMPLVYFVLVKMMFHHTKADAKSSADQLLEVTPPAGA